MIRKTRLDLLQGLFQQSKIVPLFKFLYLFDQATLVIRYDQGLFTDRDP